MVAPEAVSKPQISAAYEPSEAVVAAVRALEDARSALFDLQAAAGVHVPLAVDLRLAGVPLSERVCFFAAALFDTQAAAGVHVPLAAACGLRVRPRFQVNLSSGSGRSALLNLQVAASVHAPLAVDLGLAGVPSAPGLPHVRLFTGSAL